MKKVLLLNEGYSNNLGDRAINESLKRILEINECIVDSVDFIGIEQKDMSVSEITKVTSVKLKLLRKIVPVFIKKIRSQLQFIKKELKIIKKYYVNDYDFLVIGGGQLILSNFCFPMAMYLWVNKFAKKKNVKIYIIGVGAGTEFSFINKQLYNKSLDKVDKLFIRDTKSIEVLDKLFNVKSEFIPDVAFFLNNVYQRNRISTNKALVGIVDYDVYRLYNKDNKSEIQYLEEWIVHVEKLFDEGYDVELFYTTPEDYLQSIKLKNKYENKHSYDLKINESKNLEELIDVVQLAEKLISARMHGLIIAMVYGVKVIPYEISHKLKIFSNEYINNNVSIKELQEEICLVIGKLFQ